MVEQVMGTELEPGLVLQSLERKDRMEEMEFYFPVQPGFLPELASVLPEGCLLRALTLRESARAKNTGSLPTDTSRAWSI